MITFSWCLHGKKVPHLGIESTQQRSVVLLGLIYPLQNSDACMLMVALVLIHCYVCPNLLWNVNWWYSTCTLNNVDPTWKWIAAIWQSLNTANICHTYDCHNISIYLCDIIYAAFDPLKRRTTRLRCISKNTKYQVF